MDCCRREVYQSWCAFYLGTQSAELDSCVVGTDITGEIWMSQKHLPRGGWQQSDSPECYTRKNIVNSVSADIYSLKNKAGVKWVIESGDPRKDPCNCGTAAAMRNRKHVLNVSTSSHTIPNF